MLEIEVPPPHNHVRDAVYSLAQMRGLVVTMDIGLRSYQGGSHWHLRKPKASGTLEVTYWPARDRLWVTYHANRVGDGWVEEGAPQFAIELRDRMKDLQRMKDDG